MVRFSAVIHNAMAAQRFHGMHVQPGHKNHHYVGFGKSDGSIFHVI
jgi:hypothetical protein